MARLRGVPSEHHPEGPGDGPRKRRGRRSKAAGSDMRSSSPVPTPSGTKRAASPSVEVPAKRLRPADNLSDVDELAEEDDQEQLSRELEEAAGRSQLEVTEEITVRRPQTSRRHSAPLGALMQSQDDTAVSSSQSFKNKRRARMSMPAQLHVTELDEVEGERHIQFAPLRQSLDSHYRRRLRRNHLSEEMNTIDEHKKKDKRLQKEHAELRRLVEEQKRKIDQLEFQLESARLGNIDISEDQTDSLRKQLAEAHQRIEEMQASSVYDLDEDAIMNFAGSDDDEDENVDDLMLVNPSELDIHPEEMRTSPIPNGYYANRALESSQITTSQITMESLDSLAETTRDNLAENSQLNPEILTGKVPEKAVQRYQAEIDNLVHKLADATAGLRIITVELQNLDITAPGASANEILTALRRVLEDGRERYETLFSRPTADMTNSELIASLFDELEGMNTELLEKTILTEKQHQRIALVESQYEKTMDLLADSETRKNDLNTQVTELELANSNAQEDIRELEENNRDAREAINNQADELQEHSATIVSLRDQLEDKYAELEHVKTALQDYRIEIDTLEATISQLEQDHATKIADMEREHADQVADLQVRLDNEAADRVEAESQLAQQTEYVNTMEDRVAGLQEGLEKMTNEVDVLKERLEEAIEQRDAFAEERETLEGQTYEQTNTIENLQERITDLEDQIEQLTTNLKAEQTQREQTEAELAEAHETIDDQVDQIHNLGLQSNELRSKLFQVQQEREIAIAELKEEIANRNEEHAEELDTETQRRSEAEENVARLNEQVDALQEKLATAEKSIRQLEETRAALEVDRDEQLTNMERQFEDLQSKYAALETTTQAQIESLQATIIDVTNERNVLETTVNNLEVTAQDTAARNAEDLEERDAVIANLENELSEAREQNDDLAQTNKSLSQRVEHEACELLNIMGSHAQESEALKQTISVQSTHIAELQNTAEKQATAHAEELAAKQQQIEELGIVGEARGEMIVALEAQVEELKERFAAQAEDSQKAIDALLETNRHALSKQEEIAAATNKRTADALAAVREMKVKGLQVKTNGVNLNKVVKGKVTKVNERVKVSKKTHLGRVKKAKYRDSGIGFDEEEDEFGVDGVEAVGEEALVG